MKYKDLDFNIEDVQRVQLEILLEFHRICKENEIPYQLFAGTLLGSIRHKGFIPWDDDIDVCMLRKDYESFLECCKRDLSDDFFLQYWRTDKKAVLQFAKVRKNNTVFVNKTYQDSGMHNGIWIDIFPLDNVKPDALLGKLQPRLFDLLYILSSSKLKNRALNAKNRFNKTMRLFFYYALKPIPKRWLDMLCQKVLRMYENQETKYVNHLTNGASKKRLKKYLREKETFYKMIDGEFEGHLFPIPKNYDEVLRRNFGDYMKLPPEEERYPHHGIIEICLDTKKQNGSPSNNVE